MKKWFLATILLVTLIWSSTASEVRATTTQNLADQVANLGAGTGGIIYLQ